MARILTMFTDQQDSSALNALLDRLAAEALKEIRQMAQFARRSIGQSFRRAIERDKYCQLQQTRIPK